jgi:putative nucleotidyltransferase with HDIG domain
MMEAHPHRSGDPGTRSGAPIGSVRLSEVLAGLSYALDLTEGQRAGHSVRSCLIGMRIGGEIGLGSDELSSLFYALLMKDLGCSSNAARFAALFGSNDHDLKADLKSVNWSRAIESFRFVARNAAPGQPRLRRLWRLLAIMARGPEGAREVVRTRCERGADIARLLELSSATEDAIRALDEHWDGNGQPYGKKGRDIPLLGRVLGLAQTVEVFFSTHGVETAYHMAAARRGTWFDPNLVDALFAFRADHLFWQDVASGDNLQDLKFIEPSDRILHASEEKLDLVAEAFARVIDAKSPWTYQHSNGVAQIAVSIGSRLGFSARELRSLRQGALLHDLGKLGVSSLILDKPGRLTEAELQVMRRHPEHTAGILARVSCFHHLAETAASHHERLDGNGYHRGLRSAQLSQQARILCVADICDALRSSRPYRPGMNPEQVLEVMGREVGHGLDPDCFAAMRGVLIDSPAPEKVEVPVAKLVPALAEDYVQAA